MSGYVRIEFAQKFTHPTRQVVTRRRTRQRAHDRQQRPSRLPAFTALLDAMKLTPELLTRLIRDPGVCKAGTYLRDLQDGFRDIWASPAMHLWQAEDVAQLLSRRGAPWPLVLSVLIAEHDHGSAPHVPGWAGWRAMTGAHEAVRDVLDQMRHAYDWEPGHFESLLDGLLYCLLTEDAYAAWRGLRPIPVGAATLPWDGSAPRSMEEYAAAPGDFPSSMALTFVREVRRDFDDDDQLARQLETIERAAYIAIGQALEDTFERHDIAPESVADADDAVPGVLDTDDPLLEEHTTPRGPLAIGGLAGNAWRAIESDDLLMSWMDDEAEASEENNTPERLAANAQAEAQVGELLVSLPRGAREVAEAMLALHREGAKPTAPAIAKAMGKEPTAAVTAAIRQAQRRLRERSKSLPQSPPEG